MDTPSSFMLTEAPHIQQGEVVGTLYVVRPFGDFPEMDEYKESVVAHAFKSAAIADAQPYMDANPGFTFIDAPADPSSVQILSASRCSFSVLAGEWRMPSQCAAGQVGAPPKGW